MTIAEKLTQIAENEQKVFDAGYARGEEDGETVGYNAGYTKAKNEAEGEIDAAYNDGFDKGFEDGKQAALEPFNLEYDSVIYTSPYALCSVTTSNLAGASVTIELENLTDKDIRVWIRAIDIGDEGTIDDQFDWELDLVAHAKIETTEDNGCGIRSVLLMGASFL
jgi:hypothetical protein